MSEMNGLNRRAFLKGASMTALASAVGTGSTIAAAAPANTAKAMGAMKSTGMILNPD